MQRIYQRAHLLQTLVAMLITITTADCRNADRPPSQTLTQWAVHDITFEAEEHYPTPFLQQDAPLLAVTFTHRESASSLKLEGFWDGGRIWRVRFAAPIQGTWTWQSRSADPGLDDRRGELVAEAPTAEQLAANSNYHGHLRIGPTGRYFVHADGNPFFWLGDTLWKINSTACGLDGPFRTWLHDRIAKGFTAVNVRYINKMFQPNEGGLPFPDNAKDEGHFNNLNPAYFQGMDKRMQGLWDHGLVVAGPPAWFGKANDGATNVTLNDAIRLSRYLLARYGAYNIVWSLVGEFSATYRIKTPWTTADLNALGSAVQSFNVYHHPVTIHPGSRQEPTPLYPALAAVGSSAGLFHNETWLDHNWLQTGHRRDHLWRIAQRIEENYRKTQVKPVVHSEGWYERNVVRAGEDIATPAEIRWQAWAAYLNGAAGHVYGSNIWLFFDPREGPPQDNPWDRTPWWVSLASPGGQQMAYVRRFFDTIPWWTLEPRRDWVRIDGKAPEVKSLTDPHCAASPERLIVVYIPVGNQKRSLQLHHVRNDTYTAQWYSPSTGSVASITGTAFVKSGGDEIWQVPEPPDNNDWVLVLRAGKQYGR